MPIDPEIGFTADVIKDPDRFVGRSDVIKDAISAINCASGLISIYGKRGVGKSSLLRQLQQMALGDYTLAERGGLSYLIPERPRKYLTAYYACDSMIENGDALLTRLCNDQNVEDGLLRLVPDEGKEIVEFSRTDEVSGGMDLKVVQWGGKGVDNTKYAKVVPNDTVQTFRNFVNAVVSHQVQKRMKRDGLLILLDEFDVIENKDGIGSLIKSLTSPEVKFAVCGIGKDLSDLVNDHASVERLIEQGSLFLKPMPVDECRQIVITAEELFDGKVFFTDETPTQIAELSKGYPYFVQLIGKECINVLNEKNVTTVDQAVFDMVLSRLKSGNGFPTLESAYQRAIGNSTGRQTLLHLLAEQEGEEAHFERIELREARRYAEDFDIQYIDQLMPRLIDRRYGPVLERSEEEHGIYEFINPVLRQYIKLRTLK